ncbi:MAG: (5-formylfuran-3-yl)methyl phosphate synthase [Desulfovibrionaceae bacterium]
MIDSRKIQILVSVTSPEEVAEAVAGGADILDVKNPREGSLGAPQPHVVRAIREAAPAGFPVSVAIGDAPPLPGTMALAALGAAACGADYVKIGLYGPADPASAEAMVGAVCRAVRSVSPEARIMVAGYADGEPRGCLKVRDLPGAASRGGADGCMIDTLAKGEENLFSFMDVDTLRDFLERCSELGLRSALAGRLNAAHAPLLRELQPDIAGFRSAVCGGDRAGGKVDAESVRRLQNLLNPD